MLIWESFNFFIFHILSINMLKIYCKVGVARWGGKEGEMTKREREVKGSLSFADAFLPL